MLDAGCLMLDADLKGGDRIIHHPSSIIHHPASSIQP
jgi:hypothetical protein